MRNMEPLRVLVKFLIFQFANLRPTIITWLMGTWLFCLLQFSVVLQGLTLTQITTAAENNFDLVFFLFFIIIIFQRK